MSENIQAIQEIVDMINCDQPKIPSAVEAARKVNYDRSHWSKLFRRSTGITYSKYATIMKMGVAAAELRNTEKTITEIAEMLDYSEPEAFTHAFTTACGCSPTDYRKNPESISVPFCKIITNKEKGVIIMGKIEPEKIIGDNFLKLLALQPVSIVMYCFLASFAASPAGMLKDYNPKGNTLPSIEISRDIAEMLPLSIDEIFFSLIELEDVGLLTIVAIENESVQVVINPIPEKITSNGTQNDYDAFIKTRL